MDANGRERGRECERGVETVLPSKSAKTDTCANGELMYI